MKTLNNELRSARVYIFVLRGCPFIDRPYNARACVTIFNFATICKRRNTDRPIILKERTCRRNPRSTSLFVIAYDRRCALYSSTSVRFSLLSLPPSIVLSYAPFRSPSVFHQFTVLSIRVQYYSVAMIETSNIFPSISLENNNFE